uniref:Tubulin--tyrosine ligase-like protein 5 n=1 Tax=Guillardia theta TaxID=55529 RepID=A0A7S4KSZ3_GUITH|mmetsp:Transcript_30532/g.98376  ORF Transcript_30532/g.98376 Transcript_30532/m.98376 type:complete len:629 (+) Transcript_30532:66-1952(+)
MEVRMIVAEEAASGKIREEEEVEEEEEEDAISSLGHDGFDSDPDPAPEQDMDTDDNEEERDMASMGGSQEDFFEDQDGGSRQAVGEEVQEKATWQARARRLEQAGEQVDAALVPFSLIHDVRKEEEAAPKNKFFFKIDGASSNCVRNAWRRAGGVRTQKGGWNVWWGRPLKQEEYKKLNMFQRVCHFPGTFFLGRKDSLAKSIVAFRRSHGQASFTYLPKTYLHPEDRERLLTDSKEKASRVTYIVKPRASARGQGIKLVSQPESLGASSSCVVQEYIDKPLLIDGRKFDMRLYVLVTSFDPLRLYLYQDGLARFCTETYDEDVKGSSGDLFRHLTNYSVNKTHASFLARGAEDGEKHPLKWSLKALKEHLEERGVDTKSVFEQVEDLIVKTLLAVEGRINSKLQQLVPYRNNCYELFGFDVMLDASLHPWLIEVNTSPSLAADSQLDKRIKNGMVVDMFNMLGICTYSRRKLKELRERKESLASLAFSSRLQRASVTDKHRQVEVCKGKRNPLEDLTELDEEIIRETEEELELAGGFKRLFPSPSSDRLRRFMQPRYNNLLLAHWLDRHGCRALDRVLKTRRRSFKGEEEEENSCSSSAPKRQAQKVLRIVRDKEGRGAAVAARRRR